MKTRQDGGWTFLTNHTHVLLAVMKEPSLRLRDLADVVGITERAVHRIVVDLEDAGCLSHHRLGRRSLYKVHPKIRLRHPLEAHHTIGELLALLASGAPSKMRRDA